MCIPPRNQTRRCVSHCRIRLAMCIPLRNQTRQCASHLGIKPGNLHPMAESNSAMCIPQQNQTQRCASHRGIRLSNVHPTEESDSVVCKTVHHAEESVTCLSWPKRVCFYMRFKKVFFPLAICLYIKTSLLYFLQLTWPQENKKPKSFDISFFLFPFAWPEENENSRYLTYKI